MAQSIPYMVYKAGLAFNTFMLATDARGAQEGDAGAFGIIASNITNAEVEQLLRLGEEPALSVARANGDLGGLKHTDRAIRATVPKSRLPHVFTEPERWHPVDRGTWQYQDHICLGEARTVIKAMGHMSTFPALRDKIQFSLQDDTPVAYVWAKGRAASWPLNYLARKRAALSLATGSRIYLPWVESARQPADGLSRSI